MKNHILRLSKICKNLGKAKVLVIGDLILDKYVIGGVDRISPEAPVPILKVREEKSVLGGAANVAQNLVSLGCQVSLAGYIGDDIHGQHIQSMLKHNKIGSFVKKIKEFQTVVKIRLIGQNQQLLRIDYEDKPNGNILSSADSFIKRILDNLDQFDLIVVSDYAKHVFNSDLAVRLMYQSSRLGKKVIIDPKPQNKDCYQNAYLITPNLKEASEMTGVTGNEEKHIHRMGQMLVNGLNSNVLITCSERGMCLFERDGTRKWLAAAARSVYDVTGAGDTVVATLAAALAIKTDLVSASKLSNLAAGVVVGKMGAASVSIAELVEEVKSQHEIVNG